jgi:nicotinamide mononucleotide transporter
MSPVEIIAALATLINVYLTAKNNVWCWICGVIAVVLYGYVFYVSHLYSSMGLQAFYYLPMQFYGWWVWLRWGPTRDNDLPITRLSRSRCIFWFGINLPLAALLGYLMTFTGAQLSYADALVTAMSIIAQYLLTYKYIENWVLWILVDLVYAFYLLPIQGLYVSAVLYLILLIMAIWGLREWSRILRGQSAVTSEDAVHG